MYRLSYAFCYEVYPLPDIRSLPSTTLLAPFFAIIRSPLSTGPITSAALTSLHNFFQCGLLSPTSVSLEACLSELSSTVSRCKFEASDTSGDEVTLLKIMTVIQDCMCGSVGDNLGDIEVCEMLETVLTTCCQMRLSGGCFCHPPEACCDVLTAYAYNKEILRRSAEATMHALVKIAFKRLYVLDAQEEEKRLSETDGPGQDNEVKMAVASVAKPEDPPPTVEEDSETTHVEQEGKTAEEKDTVQPEPTPKEESMFSRETQRPKCGSAV